jgi:hypothetical protein
VTAVCTSAPGIAHAVFADWVCPIVTAPLAGAAEAAATRTASEIVSAPLRIG